MTAPTPYHLRRQRLMDKLPNNTLAIVPSGQELTRNRDTDYPFRAQSDFIYLTGFNEPDSVLILEKTDDALITHLGLRVKNPEKEIWDGHRLGVDAAPASLAIEKAFDVTELDAQLLNLLQHKTSIYLSFEQNATWHERLFMLIKQLKRKVRQGVGAPSSIIDLDTLLHEQRLLKDSHEMKTLRQAASVTVAGHLAAMRHIKLRQHEYQVQADLEFSFKNLGAERLAFSSIVASGKNACVLHYHENNASLEPNALILIDAGAEISGMAGDCTHTFPIGGRFTQPQALLYDLVLSAQQAAIQEVKPGVAFDVPHQTAVRILTQGLLDLGLLQGECDTAIKDGLYKRFYMHQTSHWLGYDVHDVGSYQQSGCWRYLQAGMALTIEPGLYIAADDMTVDSCWRGIGIRIEDSLLVTDTGHELLTQGIPRTRAEIESWMKQH